MFEPASRREESNSTILAVGSSWAEATQKKKQRARKTENLAIMRFQGEGDRKENEKGFFVADQGQQTVQRSVEEERKKKKKKGKKKRN
jgi:hypothetical protein